MHRVFLARREKLRWFCCCCSFSLYKYVCVCVCASLCLQITGATRTIITSMCVLCNVQYAVIAVAAASHRQFPLTITCRHRCSSFTAIWILSHLPMCFSLNLSLCFSHSFSFVRFFFLYFKFILTSTDYLFTPNGFVVCFHYNVIHFYEGAEKTHTHTNRNFSKNQTSIQAIECVYSTRDIHSFMCAFVIALTLKENVRRQFWSMSSESVW